MTGKTLHEFDLALCNYALDNIRAHMDKPDFAKYVEEFLEPPVLAHLGALGDDGEPQPLLLNEDDLFGIASNFEGGPEEFDLSWEPLGTFTAAVSMPSRRFARSWRKFAPTSGHERR